MEISHRPSGSMCAVCKHKHLSCGWLSFETMQVIKVDKDGTKVVKCDNFEKEVKKDLTPQSGNRDFTKIS